MKAQAVRPAYHADGASGRERASYSPPACNRARGRLRFERTGPLAKSVVTAGVLAPTGWTD